MKSADWWMMKKRQRVLDKLKASEFWSILQRVRQDCSLRRDVKEMAVVDDVIALVKEKLEEAGIDVSSD